MAFPIEATLGRARLKVTNAGGGTEWLTVGGIAGPYGNRVYFVASEVAMLQLVPQVGDQAVRTDISVTYAYQNAGNLGPADLTSWFLVGGGNRVQFCATEAEMYAMVPKVGDLAVRTDQGITYAYQNANFLGPANATSWYKIAGPMQRYITTVGDDVTTTFTVAHDFNLMPPFIFVTVQAFDFNQSQINCGVTLIDGNNVSVEFDIPPTAAAPITITVTA